tara:strand:+ start:57 stop:185 length:129 start_codon:yes stop_codon:yes gene_type:complete
MPGLTKKKPRKKAKAKVNGGGSAKSWHEGRKKANLHKKNPHR